MGRNKLPVTAEWQDTGQVVLRIGKKQVGSIELVDDYGVMLVPEKIYLPLADLIVKEVNLLDGQLRETLDSKGSSS